MPPLPGPAYWSRLPFPVPGDLPDPGIEPGSPALQADSLPSEPPGQGREWVTRSHHLHNFRGDTPGLPRLHQVPSSLSRFFFQPRAANVSAEPPRSARKQDLASAWR